MTSRGLIKFTSEPSFQRIVALGINKSDAVLIGNELMFTDIEHVPNMLDDDMLDFYFTDNQNNKFYKTFASKYIKGISFSMPPTEFMKVMEEHTDGYTCDKNGVLKIKWKDESQFDFDYKELIRKNIVNYANSVLKIEREILRKNAIKA